MLDNLSAEGKGCRGELLESIWAGGSNSFQFRTFLMQIVEAWAHAWAWWARLVLWKITLLAKLFDSIISTGQLTRWHGAQTQAQFIGSHAGSDGGALMTKIDNFMESNAFKILKLTSELGLRWLVLQLVLE